mmetsp:Transcript_65295/g.115886  ORF Transcript_65295/g.115886 Transcript_65295/m.115886 type:complete len:299 (+) Transcript_65295:167-1063(+)
MATPLIVQTSVAVALSENGGMGTMGPCKTERLTDGHGPWGCDSLNSDPFNLRAEELAMQDCALGVEVRRTWTEQEMVRSFGGQMSPGTPDGMFESWDGDLTCVQVVRVPIVESSDVDSMKNTLTKTVLTKVVKSQSWLRFTQAMPKDFVIFCWLPYAVPEEVTYDAEQLMQRVRFLDPRFSLRLRTPAEPSSIFPALFATNHEFREKRRTQSYTESDISVMGSESLDLQDEPLGWDITWGWDVDLGESLEAADENCMEILVRQPGSDNYTKDSVDFGGAVDDDDDSVCEWNITWDDNG